MWETLKSKMTITRLPRTWPSHSGRCDIHAVEIEVLPMMSTNIRPIKSIAPVPVAWIAATYYSVLALLIGPVYAFTDFKTVYAPLGLEKRFIPGGVASTG
jgi:hypothetical protein